MKIAIAVVLLLGLGCSTNETVKQVRALADKACACTDAACAEAVDREYLELVKGGQKRGSQDDRDEIEKDHKRMRDCIATARGGQPVTPQ
jgi:hypothetical protein